MSGSATGAAEAVEVDGVVRRDEAFGLGERVKGLVECAFELGFEGDVADKPARFADQVVVVLGERFGEFEVSVLAAVNQPSDDTGLFE